MLQRTRWAWIALILLLCPHSVSAQGRPIPIYTIQGDRLISPLDNRRVDTFGMVTAITETGFYLQDPAGDGDGATSDGLFAYTRRRPALRVGTCVTVVGGLVDEFYEKTELTQVSMGKITPSDECGAARVVPVRIPAAQLHLNPATIFEQYEGMLVEVVDLAGVVQGPTKRFASGEAEISFLAESLLPYIENGRIYQDQPENTAALMYLSSALGGDLPDLGFGDRLDTAVGLGTDGAVLAILDYNFGKYQILALPGQAFTGEDRAFPEHTGFAAGADDFTVCTLNALALGRGTAQRGSEADYAEHLQRSGLVIAQRLHGCTIIGVQETGTPADANNLAARLATEFELPYTAVSLPGPNTSSPEFPLTNSVLVRDDRVTVLNAESRQGCSPVDYEIDEEIGVCPPGQFSLFNRPPLVVDLSIIGSWSEPYTLTLITNHWKSKGGDESINVVRRTNQAAHVATLVQEKVDANPDAHVIVLGDLNDYYGSGPVEMLKTTVEPDLVHIYDFLPPLSRYTYIYNGASQVLDHILVTPNLVPTLAGIMPVHINADFPTPRTVDPTNVHHASDHDPVSMRIRPQGASWLSGNVIYGGVGVQVRSRRGDLVAEAVSDAQGEVRLWGLTTGLYTVFYHAPEFVSLEREEARVLLVPGSNQLPDISLYHQSVLTGTTFSLLTPLLSEWEEQERE